MRVKLVTKKDCCIAWVFIEKGDDVFYLYNGEITDLEYCDIDFDSDISCIECMYWESLRGYRMSGDSPMPDNIWDLFNVVEYS